MSVLNELLNIGAIEPAAIAHATSTRWLADAARHITAADMIADIDPSGAIMLAYEAARMSVAAALLNAGYRVRSRVGSQQVLARFAEDLAIQTRDSALTQLDSLRSYRSQFDFRPDGDFVADSTANGTGGIHDAIATAAAIRAACSEAIHSEPER